MSTVSLPYTTLDGRIGALEPVPWYWRLFSHLSTWLILGGYLAFPYLTLTTVSNPDGSTSPPPVVSTTALIIVVTSFITAGIALTPLLIFATPHNREFHLHSVFLPAFSATLLGTISHVLVSTLTPYHNIGLLAGVVGACLGIVSSIVYAAFSLFVSGIVHTRLGRPDPYGRRVLQPSSQARAFSNKGMPIGADRNASYSSSVVPLAQYASNIHGLQHQASSASGGSSRSQNVYQQSSYYTSVPQATSTPYFPPAPFIHPLQNFNWQQQQQQQQQQQHSSQHSARRSSNLSSVMSPPSQNPFPHGPVSIVPRAREIGTAPVDIQEDELTRQQMAALLSQGRGEDNVARGATYHIDFPGAPPRDGSDSSGNTTPQYSVATTPSAFYPPSHVWHNVAAGQSGIWNGGAMGTLSESPIEGDESQEQIHEVEGGGPTSLLARSLTPADGERDASSLEKIKFHDSRYVDAPSVAAPTAPPAVAVPKPPAAGRRSNAMNALGAAVLGRGPEERRGRQMSESDSDRVAREKRERREVRQQAEDEQRERDRQLKREDAERKRRQIQEQEREDAMMERRQEGEELRRLREMSKMGRKPSFQDFSPVRIARQRSEHSARST